MLDQLPLQAITSFIGIVLVIVFFVTSSDSGSLVIDTITAGGETISLEIQPGAQGQYLDGSWDARAGLLENLGAAKTVAEKLPYVSNYA